MKIEVRAYGEARSLLGSGSTVVELKERVCLEELLASLGLGEDAGSWLLLVNGKDVRPVRGVKTPLADGDVVDLIPPARGGQA